MKKGVILVRLTPCFGVCNETERNEMDRIERRGNELNIDLSRIWMFKRELME